MQHIAAIDLDETLLHSDGAISAFTLDVLQRWRTAGNQIIIATGRPPRSIPSVLPTMLHDTPWICYNGAEIHQAGVQIFCDLIPPAHVAQLIEYIQQVLPNSIIGVELGGVLRLSAYFERPFKTEIIPIEQLSQSSAAKVLLFGVDYATASRAMGNAPSTVRVMLSEKHRLVQMMSPTADKAYALQSLVQGWQQSMAQVVAFGDDINDVDMLRLAGVGVAMSNAIREVQAAADRVTGSNDEDGVAVVLLELLAKQRL